MNDEIHKPRHYTAGDIECIDALKAALTAEEFRGFLKGNIIKYTWRERFKDGFTSMQKALWYTKRLIREMEYAQETVSKTENDSGDAA